MTVLQAFGDGKVFGQRFGEGPPRVVFLHGWGRTSHDFTAVASSLVEDGISSVAIDLPGFGASPLPTVAGGARAYGELLLPVLDEISAFDLLIVGHSFGGRVAVSVAATHPERVAGLVLSGVPLLRHESAKASPWRYRAIRWLRQRGLVSEATMEGARQRFGSLDYRNASGLLRDILVATVNESYEQELAQLRCPVALIWGSDDRAVPLAVATRAQEIIPSETRLRSVADCGHLLPTTAPAALVDAVRELLA